VHDATEHDVFHCGVAVRSCLSSFALHRPLNRHAPRYYNPGQSTSRTERSLEHSPHPPLSAFATACARCSVCIAPQMHAHMVLRLLEDMPWTGDTTAQTQPPPSGICTHAGVSAGLTCLFIFASRGALHGPMALLANFISVPVEVSKLCVLACSNSMIF